MHILLPFSARYMFESGFCALISLKTKARNKLDCESDMHCALSSAKSRIKVLVSKKQPHPSHACENKLRSPYFFWFTHHKKMENKLCLFCN